MKDYYLKIVFRPNPPKELEGSFDKLQIENNQLKAWIEKARDKFVFYGLDNPDEVCLADFCRFAAEFNKIIDDAPI